MDQKQYKKMTHKEIEQLKRKLQAIYKAAKTINHDLIGKKIYYQTENDTLEFIFHAANFMHLCGIEYKRGAALFFQDCLDKKLVLSDIAIKKDGTTFQKLQVVGSIHLLFTSSVSIVGQGRYARLYYDAAIRTRRKILALALKQTGSNYVPVSLLNLQTKETGSGERVLSIYTEDFDTKEKIVLFKKEDSLLDN